MEIQHPNYGSSEISPDDNTTAHPIAQEGKSTGLFGEKGDTAAGVVAGIVRGLSESKLNVILPIIALLGFILIAFSGHMITWKSFFIYTTFLAVTILYSFFINMMLEKTQNMTTPSKNRLTFFLIGITVGVIIAILFFKYLFSYL